MKSSISITHENCEGSVSLTLRTRNLRRPSWMLARNWKHQWLPLCPAKLWRRIVGVVYPIELKNTCMYSGSWWIQNTAYGRMFTKSSWRPYCRRRKQFITALQFGSHFYSYASSLKKNPAAKAAVDKEWEKLKKISAWNLTKVRRKKEVIDEARTKGAKVDCASLMDICHLKNAELEAKHQKYKGRVVFRGDIVKDDSGSYAVFTEQGSSASQMTAAKVMDIISRLPGLRRTSSGRSICWYPSKNGRCSQIIENSQIGMSRHLDSSTMTQMA